MHKSRLLITLLVFACALPLVTRAAEDTRLRTLSVTGESIVYAVPDQVRVTVGIESQADTLEAAVADNETNANSLLKAVKALGIDEKNIQTDHLNVQVSYRNIHQEKIPQFSVQRSYAIKLKDVKLFQNLIETALKNGANQLHGVDFQTTELGSYRQQAREEAVKAAQEKAAFLAKELGVKVGKPLTINEGGSGYLFSGGYRASSMAMERVSGGQNDMDTLPLGQIGIQANVSVVFEVTD